MTENNSTVPVQPIQPGATTSAAEAKQQPDGKAVVDAIVSDAVAQPSAEEVEQQLRDAEMELAIADNLVDMTADMPEEDAMLSIDDPKTGQPVAICHSQDLVTVKAAPKQGKSTLLSIMVAVLCCGQWQRMKSALAGRRILYIDTEMKPRDTQRMGRQALKLAGISLGHVPEGFIYVNLRKDSPAEILPKLEYLIRRYRPDVVFIDGSLDLCNNFNDPEESQQLVKGLYLRLIDTYHCTIITAIHTNKTNDTHASQGHLGATLDKKGEVTLECQLDKSSGIVTVSAPTCRHQLVPEFYFRYGEGGLPVGCDAEVVELKAIKELSAAEANEKKKQEAFNELVLKVSATMQNVGTSGIPQAQLVKMLMPVLGLKDSAIQSRVKMLKEAGYLLPKGFNGNLIFNPKNTKS